jgi:hypothetical protein
VQPQHGWATMGVVVISAIHRQLLRSAAWLLIAGSVLSAQAQDAPPADSGEDPPARAGRLAWLEGSVSLQPAGLSDWNAAPVNQPLTAGDAVWSDNGSRAELDLGQARVRLDQRSSVAILDLSDRAVQLRLDAGSIDVAVSDVADLDSFEIDAPNAAVSLLRPGEYRFSVDNASSTSVAIRSGQAQVQSSDRQSLTLGAGQRGLYGDNGSYAVTPAGAPDDFDRWCQQRQARWADEQAAAQYVSSDAVGYQDLSDAGQWQQQPDYGYVWFPTQVAEDWVPYSNGHWAWIAPWGWSWIDDAPWGFAPFHYGRWCHIGRRWGWVPAPPHHHAVYAPALVAWVGGPGKGGAAAALGGGSAVGWLPLAPGEVFVPAYRASPRYLQNINLSNSRRLNPALVTSVAGNPELQARYANRDIPGALTVVPQVSFTAGQSVTRHRISPPQQWQSAAPMARVPAIAPERESVLGALSLSRVATPPSALADRPVVTRRPPPAAVPSFERQQSAIAANGARPLDAAQLQSLRAAEPIRRLPSQGTASTHVTAPAASGYRGIPERSPQFQGPAQAQAPDPNVFKQRDREIEEERRAQAREQQSQPLQPQTPRSQPQIQAQPRFQSQPQQPRLQEQQVAPQPVARPQPVPAPHPQTEPRRVPEQGPAPSPSSQR